MTSRFTKVYKCDRTPEGECLLYITCVGVRMYIYIAHYSHYLHLVCKDVEKKERATRTFAVFHTRPSFLPALCV